MSMHTRRDLGRLRATVAAIGAGVLIAAGLAVPAGAAGEARPEWAGGRSGSNPEEQMARSGLAATADEQDFVVAAPQGGVGSGTSWAWNVPHVTTAPGAPDDQGPTQGCTRRCCSRSPTRSMPAQ
jgi:hypothetical protein